MNHTKVENGLTIIHKKDDEYKTLKLTPENLTTDIRTVKELWEDFEREIKPVDETGLMGLTKEEIQLVKECMLFTRKKTECEAFRKGLDGIIKKYDEELETIDLLNEEIQSEDAKSKAEIIAKLMDVFEIKDRIVIDEVKMMNNTPEQIIEECLKTMAQDKLIIKVKDGVFKKL